MREGREGGGEGWWWWGSSLCWWYQYAGCAGGDHCLGSNNCYICWQNIGSSHISASQHNQHHLGIWSWSSCLGKNLSQESWPLIETLIGFYKRTLSTEMTGGREGRDSDLAWSWNILLLLANTTFRQNSRFPLGFNNLIMSMENTLGLISGVKKKYYVN